MIDSDDTETAESVVARILGVLLIFGICALLVFGAAAFGPQGAR